MNAVTAQTAQTNLKQETIDRLLGTFSGSTRACNPSKISISEVGDKTLVAIEWHSGEESARSVIPPTLEAELRLKGVRDIKTTCGEYVEGPYNETFYHGKIEFGLETSTVSAVLNSANLNKPKEFVEAAIGVQKAAQAAEIVVSKIKDSLIPAPVRESMAKDLRDATWNAALPALRVQESLRAPEADIIAAARELLIAARENGSTDAVTATIETIKAEREILRQQKEIAGEVQTLRQEGRVLGTPEYAKCGKHIGNEPLVTPELLAACKNAPVKSMLFLDAGYECDEIAREARVFYNNQGQEELIPGNHKTRWIVLPMENFPRTKNLKRAEAQEVIKEGGANQECNNPRQLATAAILHFKSTGNLLFGGKIDGVTDGPTFVGKDQILATKKDSGGFLSVALGKVDQNVAYTDVGLAPTINF